MGIDNDFRMTKVSDKATALPVASEPISSQATTDVHEVSLKQALEAAGEHLQQIISTLREQHAASPKYAGPPPKDQPIDKSKMNLPEPPKDLSDPNQAAEYQQKMSEYSNMMNMISNVLRMLEDTSKSVAGNLR